MTKETGSSGIGDLPLYASGLTLAELDLKGGKGFWSEVERFTGESELGTKIDAAMDGKASPRVWTLHAAPGNNGPAAAAALIVARVLAARGQATIVVDGNDHNPDLTRWSGRFELEGWIDLVRYGASLTTSSVSLDFEGKKSVLVGVGSFCPTQATDEEIGALLARLRRQADDVIIVAPSGAQGRAWAVHAQIRLLCWDQLSLSADAAEQLVGSCREAGYEITGLVGFGVTENEVIERKIRPEDSADWLPSAEEDEPAVAESTPAVEERIVREEESVAEEEPEVEASESASAESTEQSPEVPREDWGREERSRRTSGVFWGVAAVFLICIVAAGGYYMKFVRGPQQVISEPMVPVSMQATNQSSASARDSDGLAVDAGAGDELAVDAGDNDPTEPTESDVLVTPPTSDPVVDELTGSTEEVAASAAEPVRAEDRGRPDAPAATSGESDSFDREPYNVTVGQGGWAIHLFSFPDEKEAQDEARRLEAKNINAVVMPVDLSAKGRCTGSASAALAVAARRMRRDRLCSRSSAPTGRIPSGTGRENQTSRSARSFRPIHDRSAVQ